MEKNDKTHSGGKMAINGVGMTAQYIDEWNWNFMSHPSQNSTQNGSKTSTEDIDTIVSSRGKCGECTSV